MKSGLLSGVAAAALGAAVLAASPAMAQQAQDDGQARTQQQGQAQQGESQLRAEQRNQAGGQAMGGPPVRPEQDAGMPEDMLIAKVGDAEIRGRDVREALEMLPPRMRQQPAEMLVPMAIDQLVMRELILQRAQEDGLENDPDVEKMIEQETQEAREQAMMRVWLQRELDDRVTQEKVDEVWEGLKAARPDEQLPPLETLRPMIERQVRQQAFAEIRNDLREGADVTFYGPQGDAGGAQEQSGNE